MRLSSFLPPPGVLIVGVSLGLYVAFVRSAQNDGTDRVDSGDFAVSAPQKEILVVGLGAIPSGNEFVERPLFSQDRREAQSSVLDSESPDQSAQPVGETEVEIPPPEIRLIGTIAVGETRRALLKFEEDGREEWLEAGATLLGWTLVEISQDSISLSHGGQEIAIRQFD